MLISAKKKIEAIERKLVMIGNEFQKIGSTCKYYDAQINKRVS